MLAWHLGSRYLRKRRAAWLALAAITLTVAVPVAVLGVMEGFVEVMTRQVRASESDLTCEPPHFVYGLADTPERRAQIMAIPGVEHVAPFIDTVAMMTPRPYGRETRADARFTIACQVDAVEWDRDWAMGRIAADQLHPAPTLDLHQPPLSAEQRGSGFLTQAWRAHLALAGLGMVPGLAPLPLPPRARPLPGVVVGRELAFINGLLPGQQVHLIAPNGAGGATGKVSVEIADTLGTGIYEVDRLNALLPLPIGRLLADMAPRGDAPGHADGYRLAIDQRLDLDEVRATVEAGTGLRATTWMERRGNFVKSAQLQRNILVFVMIAIEVITIFVVYAVFSTLVAEKRHDIGVLLGLGARPRTIAAAFLLASIAACVAGGLLGWAIGWGVLAVLNPLCRWQGWALFPQDIMYTPDTPISYDPWWPLLFMLIMTGIGVLAAAIPAWRAGRIDPVQILREGA